jgi:hypothetical protein
LPPIVFSVELANNLTIEGRKLSPGFPEASIDAPIRIEGIKAADILGVKMRSMEEMLRGTMEDFAKRGF